MTAAAILAHIFHELSGHAGWLVLLGSAGCVLIQASPSPAGIRLHASLSGTASGTRRLPGRLVMRLIMWARAYTRQRVDTVLGRSQARRRRAVIELCRTLAAELRAGRAPAAADESALGELDPAVSGEWALLAAVARSGDDLAAALQSVSVRPGSVGLAYLAACWRVAAGTGAGLADVVDRLAESLAHEDQSRQELTAQLAGPRATAIMLSALPALGLAMATALGGAPLIFLFTTPAGLLCLAAGILLDTLGLWWTHRMVRRALAAHGTE